MGHNFNHKRRTYNSSASMRGVAFVEFAIVLPLLLLLITGTFEISNLLRTYNALNSISYQTTRLYASNPSLELGQYVNISQSAPCGGGALTCPVQAEAQKWTEKILRSYDSSWSGTGAVWNNVGPLNSITTGRGYVDSSQNFSAMPASTSQPVIFTKLELQYRGFFGLYQFPLVANSWLPMVTRM